MFASEFGTPIDPRNILRTIQVAAQKAACPTSGCTRCAIVPPWPGSRRGVHIKAMADLLGVTRVTLSGWERGRALPSLEKAVLIEQRTGILPSAWPTQGKATS